MASMQRKLVFKNGSNDWDAEFTHSVIKDTSEVNLTNTIDRETMYFSVLNAASHYKMNLLPSGVRWISSDFRSMIIEEAPTYRTLNYHLSANTSTIAFNLPMPWVYYGISPMGNVPYVSHIICTFDQLSEESIADIMSNNPSDGSPSLYMLAIPNVYMNGRICTHDIPEWDEGSNYHLMVSKAISEFWSSNFNDEVGDFKSSSTILRISTFGSNAYSLPRNEMFPENKRYRGTSHKQLNALCYWEAMDIDYLFNLHFNAKQITFGLLRGSPFACVMSLRNLIKDLLSNSYNDYYGYGHQGEKRFQSTLAIAGTQSIMG